MRLSGWEKGNLPCRRKHHGKAENQGRALWVGRSVGCAAETASYHADRVCGDPTKDAHDLMRDLYFTLQSKRNTEWLLAHI